MFYKHTHLIINNKIIIFKDVPYSGTTRALQKYFYIYKGIPKADRL